MTACWYQHTACFKKTKQSANWLKTKTKTKTHPALVSRRKLHGLPHNQHLKVTPVPTEEQSFKPMLQ